MSDTFAVFYFTGEQWFLHSWGHERDELSGVFRTVLTSIECLGVKATPTPESLRKIVPEFISLHPTSSTP